MKLSVVLLMVLIAGTACEPDWEQPYESFLIPAGQHSKGVDLQFLQSDELSFYAIFDESAKYESLTEENQWDINKLIGFADCNAHHHQNSARFGWRWLKDSLEIMAYCYVDGERLTEKVGTVELNKPSLYQIKLTDEFYSFTLNDLPTVSIPRKKPCDQGAYYMLWPYFGGDEVAPHDINIRLKLNW